MAQLTSVCTALLACFAMIAPRTVLPCCTVERNGATEIAWSDDAAAPRPSIGQTSLDDCCSISGPRVSAASFPCDSDEGSPRAPCTGCVAPCCAKVAVPAALPCKFFSGDINRPVSSIPNSQPDAPAQDGVFHPPKTC